MVAQEPKGLLGRALSAVFGCALGVALLFTASNGVNSATGDPDFSIGVDPTLLGAGTACDSSGTPSATCNIPLGAKFKVNFYVRALATGMSSGVAGYDATLQYSGITSSETHDSVDQGYWPPCKGPVSSFSPGQVSMGCSVLLNQPSSYVGKFATVEFMCAASGVVTLRSGQGWTDISDDELAIYAEAADESLTVNCIPPQPYPGDTDGDGCPDTREQGINMMAGGRRGFLNPWDWWDPTGDGMTRIADVLAVAMHYGANAGGPNYDEKYDRTYLGPNPWNLGPPDGMVRSVDINMAVRHYGAACS